jgi:hypothetical protein
MERRMARIDAHIEALVTNVLAEEKKIESDEQIIEKQEAEIESALGIKAKSVKKAVKAKKGKR